MIKTTKHVEFWLSEMKQIWKKRLNQKIKKLNIYEKGQANLKLTDGEAADVDCKDIHGIQGTLCSEFWSLKYLIITSIDAQNQIYLNCR